MSPNMLVKNLLLECDRFDKRDFLETRMSNIVKMKDSYLLDKGKTQIWGSLDISEVKPYVDKPQEGVVGFNVYVNNKRSDRFNNFLYKIYVSQKSIDLERLCLVYDRKVLSMYFDMKILNLDGDPYEPLVNMVNYMLKDIDVPLNFLPNCFYFIAINDIILRDPIDLEEAEKDWYLLIVKRSTKQFIYIEKLGGECLETDIYQIIDLTNKEV